MEEYKGATIEPGEYGGFVWHHPNYADASWNGDGWDTFGCGYADDIESCKEEIDEFFEELEEREVSGRLRTRL